LNFQSLLIFHQCSFQVALRFEHRPSIVVRPCHIQGIGHQSFSNF
jgi:hypothetical protein